MKKILVTGITGFAGSHLAQLLTQDPQNQVSGTFIAENSITNVSEVKEKLDLVKVDLTDKDAVASLIESKKPDEIYHLAALSAPSKSFADPVGTLNNNIAAQVYLLEAVRAAGLTETRILIIGSGDMYGLTKQEDMPIDENTPFHPTNPYAVSKIAQDYLGLQYFLSYTLPIIRVRPFNHIGPRQAPGFVVADFAKKIAAIEKGEIEPILKVGNLDAKRDFTDVRDMVRAYTLILQKGIAGDVYNIGSGTSHPIAEILEKLVGFSTAQITIEKDPSLMRPSDNPDFVCDSSKMQQITHWKPEIPLEQTLKDTLEYWRGQ